MTQFKDFTYERPAEAREGAELRDLVGRFSRAGSAAEQDAFMGAINAVRRRVASMFALREIRHTIDTTDAFYDAENEACDALKPIFEGIETDFYKALVASPFRAELERKWGSQLFTKAELQMRTFSPEVLPDLQEENRLSSEYVKLKASAAIPFEGEERNLTQMMVFLESPDRALRRRAQAAVSGFYAAHAAEFERIYDELVRLRHGIALRLGFPSFTELGYARLGRSDYGPAEVAAYRDQVARVVVPIAAGLRARQADRLGLPALKYHDEELSFLSGNARPKGDAAWIVERAREMYREMSPETGEFFDYMTGRGLMDLETRKGKAGGGYCSFVPQEKAPFIFSNFNGTSADLDVLTHEAGHAFQVWRSSGFEVPEYWWPTLEACEIHSMSMEFLAWPWMGSVFGADEAKYKFAHLSAGILFLPYGVSVDEFQHWVYAHPSASPEERRAAWRATERKYLPWRDYDGDDFLESGAYWLRQGHIFQDPFYYIDYTLAQVCAYEYWGRSRADRPAAWASYLALCGLGGSRPFTGLLGAAGLSNPFDEGSIARIMEPVGKWLREADDRAL